MSKTKLAILVFVLAFGLNAIPFLFSKKAYVVEEVKNVWLYELPPSASPLDSYPSLEMGPAQGVIGTLFRPEYSPEDGTPSTLLADQFVQSGNTLRITLKAGLTYSDKSAILASHFVEAHHWLVKKVAPLSTPEWTAWRDGVLEAMSDHELRWTWSALPPNFQMEKFFREVLSHPWSGVIHPKNLESLTKGEKITRGWLASGPYKVMKWNPKEVIIVSRDDFPVKMDPKFFRTVRFQSAPVKNPSCEFMQGRAGEAPPSDEHQEIATTEEVHVFWACRSWKDANGFCLDPARRAAFKAVLEGKGAANALAGQSVRYRIPVGNDAFRMNFRKALESKISAAGGKVSETSYFFKESKDADIELEFVVSPRFPGSLEWARERAILSSRLGDGSENQENLVGEIEHFPLAVFMKKMKGNVYQKVFLEPDLEEKKIGI